MTVESRNEKELEVESIKQKVAELQVILPADPTLPLLTFVASLCLTSLLTFPPAPNRDLGNFDLRTFLP